MLKSFKTFNRFAPFKPFISPRFQSFKLFTVGKLESVLRLDFAGDRFFRKVLAHGALVGSQQVRRFSLKPSRRRISSALISKSKTSAFSNMRVRLADFGMTTKPRCSAQRMRICAVDLVSEWRDSLSKKGNRDRSGVGCGPAFEYFLANATSFGSFRRAPLVKGL